MSEFDFNIWKQLNNLQESGSFIDEEDFEDFKEYLYSPSKVLMEMANAIGNNVRREKNLPFSFFFSSKKAVRGTHGIRVKILWNPAKAPADADGFLELHGDFEYIPGSHKYEPNAKELSIARRFFKKYKVLFSAVWEDVIYDPSQLVMYFYGKISWKELMKQFDTGNSDWNFYIQTTDNIKELEQLVREENMFNMND